MHYVKQFKINDVETKQVACIELHGAPNAATEGAVGVLGIDMDSPSNQMYICTAVNGGVYTWKPCGGGSVGSISLVGDGGGNFTIVTEGGDTVNLVDDGNGNFSLEVT